MIRRFGGLTTAASRKFRARHPALDSRHFAAMSWFYRNVVRPVLFSLDSEEIHNCTLKALGRASRHEVLCDALASFYRAPEMPVANSRPA